jgi:hypothetical protein
MMILFARSTIDYRRFHFRKQIDLEMCSRPETMRKCFEMMDEEPGIEEKLRQQEAELNG